MTPKNKAMALVAEYQMILMAEDTDCGCEVLCTAIAKKCALITVNEIIKEFDNYNDEIYHTYNLVIINYWNEVKKEIENL